jgi:hypothetical protein
MLIAHDFLRTDPGAHAGASWVPAEWQALQRKNAEGVRVGARAWVGRQIQRTIGTERTDRFRQLERRSRTRLADKLAPPTVRPVGTGRGDDSLGSSSGAGLAGQASDGWSVHLGVPEPTMSVPDLVAGLHEAMVPRTYLEVAAPPGAGATFSRATWIGVDPGDIERHPEQCDRDLVRGEHGDVWSWTEAVAPFRDLPVDVALLDGIHLAEYALRDFISVERLTGRSSVVVVGGALPRSAADASRAPRSEAGDVFKAVQVMARRRPDLTVVLVNASPDGAAVVVGTNPMSATLGEAYPFELDFLQAEDPQTPPPEFVSRSMAVDAAQLLGSPTWSLLATARETGNPALIGEAQDALQDIPTLG